VSKEEFATWTEQAREEFARVDSPAATIAAAGATTLSAEDNMAEDNMTVAAVRAAAPQSK
jgi:hypothetical protein